MSLILDALRKSEAERRRGQAPDLFAELPPLVTRAATRRPLWAWWLAGGFAVLASLWLLRDVASTAGAVTVPTVDASTQAASAAPDPAMAMAAPASIADSMPIAPARQKPAALRPTPEPVASASLPPAAKAAPPQPTPEPVLPPPQLAPVQVASVTPPAPAAMPAPAAIPMPAPAATAPLRLADLSAGEREQLPALKISMHMWAPAPDQRFAIIDGARVGQGDRVGDAVVEEIAADSVVLNWHGQRVALPIH
ncbi:general secretion pathway protein GspB [Lysobacter sp. S4-A87]|uniref:general secretion pathway protein GspB n=1 Tax=Lysobacter sp. S4-A87 TaxID=2925843 RepID=UPI001F52E7C2|nr:general secretion pathway protein GspB [Lysobacter sp. S4-A87]UNK49261.1 general secretion pathway protein GspB [Lysobacter sp. S4-A87]